MSVANPIVSVFLGAAVLEERLDWHPPRDGVVAIGALAIALLGAVVVASTTSEEPGSVSTETSGAAARPAVT